jgi:hypothetical protein
MFIKEKVMFVVRTCHLPNSMALFCISVDHQEAEMVVASILELGGGR